MIKKESPVTKLFFSALLCILISAVIVNAQSDSAKPAASQTFLEITVLDKVSSEAVSGAKVSVRVIQEAGGDIRKTETTDKKGKCSFPIENKNISILRLEAVKSGYVPILLSMSASQSAQKISTQQTLNLDKATVIGGKLQDPQNNPIEGVTVSVSLQSTNRDETAIISGYEVKSDANGLWVCDIIPENPDRITIRFTDPNYRPESLQVQSPSPIMQMLREKSHIMVLQKQLNLTGQVLDNEGKPIEGALVAQGADRRSMYYPDTKTDAEGRYTFENVTPGEIVLTVQADGFCPDSIRFRVDRQISPIIFRLEKGHAVKGQVVEPNGVPVRDATVSADMWREMRSLTWETRTDANGRFAWNGAPSDDFSINVNKRRYIIIRNYSVKPSQDEYVIRLYPELYVHGSVVDANSNEPVNDFRFFAGVEGGEGQDIAWKSSYKVTKRNDYEMRFTYPSDDYYIRVEAEGYEPEISRAISGGEGNVVVDFKLRKIMPVTGTDPSP
jgi:hypothetical protein